MRTGTVQVREWRGERGQSLRRAAAQGARILPFRGKIRAATGEAYLLGFHGDRGETGDSTSTGMEGRTGTVLTSESSRRTGTVLTSESSREYGDSLNE